MLIKPELLTAVRNLITQARERAVSAVDAERVLLYWHVGQVILEEEQHGADRAAYGSSLIKGLAAALQPQFGSGFSGRQMERYRQFYRTFPIASALRTQLSWTHYKTLISFDNPEKREFYLAEANKKTGRPGSWSDRSTASSSSACY